MRFKNSTIFLLVLMLVPALNYAQSKELHIPQDEEGRVSKQYTYKKKLAQELELPNMLESTYEMHIRFWRKQQVVDIWVNADGSVQGQVNNFTRNYKRKRAKKGKKLKLLQRLNALPDSLVGYTYEYITSTQVHQLASEESIDGWEIQPHSAAYVIEVSTPTSYAFKSYSAISSQQDIAEAKAVNDFIRFAYKRLDLKYEYKKFFSALPYGCYKTESTFVSCKRKKKKRKKRRRQKTSSSTRHEHGNTF